MNNSFDFKKECEKIDSMDRGELSAYLADLDIATHTNMTNEDINISVARTVCFNRAKNRVDEIRISSIRNMLKV